MLTDVVSPINFDAELLPARSPFDVVLTHRPQQKVSSISPIRTLFGSSKAAEATVLMIPFPSEPNSKKFSRLRGKQPA
jgi:hypothetical protein